MQVDLYNGRKTVVVVVVALCSYILGKFTVDVIRLYCSRSSLEGECIITHRSSPMELWCRANTAAGRSSEART